MILVIKNKTSTEVHVKKKKKRFSQKLHPNINDILMDNWTFWLKNELQNVEVLCTCSISLSKFKCGHL